MIDSQSPDYSNTPASNRRPAYPYAPADPYEVPLLTILTPFHNGRPVFHETARSIFRQSLQQWEWLIVNDATTAPASLALLDEYRGRDPRIRVIDNAENLGVAATRNVGFGAARAPYVLQVDDDDLLEPTAAEKMYWFLESYPEYAVANGWEVGFGALEYLWQAGFDRAEEHLRQNFATSRAMVRRTAHAAVGGHDGRLRGGGEDWDFWLRLADHGLWGGTIPEFLDWYRRRETHTDRWENFGPKQRAFAASLRKKYPRLYAGHFPRVTPRWHMPFDPVRAPVCDRNRLAKSRPRLLLVIPWMTIGGADKFNLDLVEQLTRRGWEVTVAATRPGDNTWMPRLAALTPDVFSLPSFLRLTDFPAFLTYLIHSRQIDVVTIAGSEFGYQILPYLRTFCPGPAYVDFLHSDAPKWKGGGYARYSAGSQDFLDLNLATSEYLKRWLVDRGADAGRIEVVYINVDADRWKPDADIRRNVRYELEISDDTPVIVFAGRLHEEKQPHVLLRVFDELARRKLDFRALVAGDGPERAWCEQYIRAHGLESRVTLFGGVPSDRVRELMAAGDVFFLPSLWEGIALALFEAMASGLVVVGADVGGQKELLTPDCGILVPKGDADVEVAAYTAALADLLADADRRRTLGAAARARIEREFTLDAMGARFLAMVGRAQGLHDQARRPCLPERFAAECAVRAVEYTRLDQEMDHLWAEAARLRSAQQEVQAQLASPEYLLARRLRRLRALAFPPGGRRERAARWCMHKQRRLRFFARQGAGPLLRALGRALARPFTRARPRTPVRRLAVAGGPNAPDGADDTPGRACVVLPVYNQAGLLADAIESVLAQSHQDVELIVINDGSTDGVEAVLDEYVGHPRVRILTQANQKLPHALSNAFEFTHGEFWTWTSADNLMEPPQLARLAAFLRTAPQAAMVYADYLLIDDVGRPLRDPNFRPQDRPRPDAPEVHLPRTTARLNTVADNFIGACFLYRGWVGRLLSAYHPSMGVEDYDYWMRMNALFEIRHLGTDEPLYRYRVHENTLNARATEHGIPQRLQNLMDLDARRRAFFARPWTIYADAPTAAWLAQVPDAAGRVQPLERLPRAGAHEKPLVLVRGDTLPQLAEHSRPSAGYVAAWFDERDPALPYRVAREIGTVTEACFAAGGDVAARLALVSRRTFTAGPGRALLELAEAGANDAVFYRESIPAAECRRTAPRAYWPAGRPLRVALQVRNFLQGGLEHVVLDIASVLDPERFDFTVLVLGDVGPAAEKARRRGVHVRQVPAGDADAYRNLLETEPFDVIHAHYSHFGAPIAADAGVPFLQTIHNTYAWLSADEIAELREADPPTRGYTCVSSAVAAYADLCLGLSPAKMLVVPNGIDTEALDVERARLDRDAARRELGFGPDDFVLLCTASITETKAQRLLVAALAAARRDEPRLKVALLGQAPDALSENGYARALAGDLKRLGLVDAVRMVGYQPDAHRFYLLADGFVLPSFIEGWSLALAEALYAGLPVVASAVGSAPELLAQTGGILLEPPVDLLAGHDGERFCRAARAAYPEYVERLADALRRAVRAPQPPRLTDALRRSFDRRRAYAIYGELYAWLAQGGDVAAARAWQRPVWTEAAHGAAGTAEASGSPRDTEASAPGSPPRPVSATGGRT